LRIFSLGQPPLVVCMISVADAASLLECSEVKLLAEGDLPGFIAGKVWVIPSRAFIEAVNALAQHEAHRRKTFSAGPALPDPAPRRRGRPPSAGWASWVKR
jgi:hypothetical protein